MQLVTLRNGAHPQAGLIIDDEVLNLGSCGRALAAARLIPTSVRQILECGEEALDLVRRVRDFVAGRDALAGRLRAEGTLIPRETANFLAPIPDPHLVLSCGRNYRSHMSEMKGGGKAGQAAADLTKEQPTGFIKNSAAVIGPGQPIILPARYPDLVDWEAEFCAVIGRPCHDVAADEALNYVVGYTMINDVSARDFIPAPGPNGEIVMSIDQSQLNLHGKQFPTFCPMGASLATSDEIPRPNDTHFELRVNGEVMQSANTGDVYFDLAALIAFFSKFYQFRPGDVVSSGSPAGVGFARRPRRMLRPGDVVEIRCDGIGRFSNPVESSLQTAEG